MLRLSSIKYAVCLQGLLEHKRTIFISIFFTFMGPCAVNIFQYISNKMQRYTVYLYLETALHVSGSTSTHLQKRVQLYLQHLVFVTPLLLPAFIVEELELLCSSNSSTTNV
jgi:hypothetical protein